MSRDQADRLLLSIVEQGGYPNFSGLYQEFGYRVVVESRMRKAIASLKKQLPEVIVAEFNFQSDFRDRSSSLESLLAVVQRNESIRVIVFYDREFAPQFERLRSRLPVHAGLPFPVKEKDLREVMAGLDA